MLFPANSSELGELIRTRIRAGRLPQADGYRLYGGKGDGSLCACCDRFITSGEIQFEVECPLPRGGGWTSLAMHLDCFHAWRGESGALKLRIADLGAEREAVASAQREQL